MSRKIITFLLSMILLLNLGVTVTFAENNNNDFDIIKVIDNGDDYNKLVIVIMGDGYTANELEKFREDANNIIDKILNEEPFNNYKEYINFYIINVISNVSGASPNKNEIIDTYFGSSFNYSYNIQRLLAPTRLDKVYDCLENSKIDYDKGIIIVNSDTYGGSGGDISVASTHPDSGEILLHEFGHSFADLGDEYFAGDQYTKEAANVTRDNNIDSVKWKSFLGNNNIGIYEMEGTNGWYIPSENCKMKVLNNPFCDVCKFEIEKRIIAETIKKPTTTDIQTPVTEDKISVKTNGKLIAFDQEPIIEGGRTLVPVRAIFEELDLNVEWDDITKTVTGKNRGLEISLEIGNVEALVNGNLVVLDVPAKVINGRTLVPVRFIAESTGAKVNWDPATKTVNISK